DTEATGAPKSASEAWAMCGSTVRPVSGIDARSAEACSALRVDDHHRTRERRVRRCAEVRAQRDDTSGHQTISTARRDGDAFGVPEPDRAAEAIGQSGVDGCRRK